MKVNFTNKSDVRLGFEIECVVVGTHARDGFGNHKKTSKWTDFKKAIQGLNRGVEIGWDGSINCSDYDLPAELRTPPLPPKAAMTLFRGFGNRDYSKKFETIAQYVKRIERLFRLSCGAFSEMRTPNI